MQNNRYLALGVREELKRQGRTQAWLAHELGLRPRRVQDYVCGRCTVSRDVAERISRILGIEVDAYWLEDKPPIPLRILLEPEGRRIIDAIAANFKNTGGTIRDGIHRSISEVVEEEVLNELVRSRIDRKAEHTRRVRHQARAAILDMAPAHVGSEMEPGIPGRTEALVGSNG